MLWLHQEASPALVCTLGTFSPTEFETTANTLASQTRRRQEAARSAHRRPQIGHPPAARSVWVAPSGWEERLLRSCTERDAALEQLKVYGRDPSFADPIFTKQVSWSFGVCMRLSNCLTHPAGYRDPHETCFRQHLRHHFSERSQGSLQCHVPQTSSTADLCGPRI